ncbi:hypothetical protein Tco_0217723 [Tanacetum coccineum]
MFVDMDTELVRESSKKDKAEMAQESSSKRAGDELEQEKAKKQKIDDDQAKARLFVELLVKRKKHFAAIRAQEKRNKPPTKAQKKSSYIYLAETHGDELEQEKAKKQKIDDDWYRMIT